MWHKAMSIPVDEIALPCHAYRGEDIVTSAHNFPYPGIG